MFKKKKQNNDEPVMENYWDVFVRNYRDSEGFRVLVKLGGYFIFVGILVILAIGVKDVNRERDDSSDQTEEVVTVNYPELLDNIMDREDDFSIHVHVDDQDYEIRATFIDNVMEGYLETSGGTVKFRIADGQVYEVNLHDEIVNPNLFSNMNLSLVVPSSLIELLKNTSYQEDNGTFIYNLFIDGISYEVKVNITEDVVDGIEILSDNASYIYEY